MKRRRSRWVRRFEIALWVVGISMLCVPLGATLDRWSYQLRQQRALFRTAESRPRRVTAVVAEKRELPAASSNEMVGPVLVPHDDRSAESGAEAGPLVSLPGSDHEDVVPSAKSKSAEEDDEPADADPSALAQIEIPRLGLEAIVAEGADEDTLARAVGYVPGTARPGEAGNTVLAGHRDTFFRPLRKLKVNDRIRLVVPPHTYEYRVDSLRIVEPNETDVLQSHGTNELTLITCYPFHWIGPAPERFIVSATRVD